MQALLRLEEKEGLRPQPDLRYPEKSLFPTRLVARNFGTSIRSESVAVVAESSVVSASVSESVAVVAESSVVSESVAVPSSLTPNTLAQTVDLNDVTELEAAFGKLGDEALFEEKPSVSRGKC